MRSASGNSSRVIGSTFAPSAGNSSPKISLNSASRALIFGVKSESGTSTSSNCCRGREENFEDTDDEAPEIRSDSRVAIPLENKPVAGALRLVPEKFWSSLSSSRSRRIIFSQDGSSPVARLLRLLFFVITLDVLWFPSLPPLSSSLSLSKSDPDSGNLSVPPVGE